MKINEYCGQTHIVDWDEDHESCAQCDLAFETREGREVANCMIYAWLLFPEDWRGLAECLYLIGPEILRGWPHNV